MSDTAGGRGGSPGLPYTESMEIVVDHEPEFALLAQCIRSGQVEADEIERIMRENPAFAKWYELHVCNLKETKR